MSTEYNRKITLKIGFKFKWFDNFFTKRHLLSVELLMKQSNIKVWKAFDRITQRCPNAEDSGGGKSWPNTTKQVSKIEPDVPDLLLNTLPLFKTLSVTLINLTRLIGSSVNLFYFMAQICQCKLKCESFLGLCFVKIS